MQLQIKKCQNTRILISFLGERLLWEYIQPAKTAFEVLANIFFVLSLKMSEISENPLLFIKKQAGKCRNWKYLFWALKTHWYTGYDTIACVFFCVSPRENHWYKGKARQVGAILHLPASLFSFCWLFKDWSSCRFAPTPYTFWRFWRYAKKFNRVIQQAFEKVWKNRIPPFSFFDTGEWYYHTQKAESMLPKRWNGSPESVCWLAFQRRIHPYK